MHHLLSILATLSLVSAIPLPQYDFLSDSDTVTGDPWDTTITDAPSSTANTNIQVPDPTANTNTQVSDPTANTNTQVPDTPLLLSENWSQNGWDSSWTGKNRQPSDLTGTGRGKNPAPETLPGGSWPATPDRDGSHAPLFNPPASGPVNEAEPPPPLPENNGDGSGGGAGAATLLFKGIMDGGLNSRPAGGP